jgi:RNA polymerase sigma factor (sigma-70 family)
VTEKTDAELVEAAKRGDRDSFAALAGRYYAALTAMAHSMLQDSHLAQDAAQETFARAVEKLDQLKNGDKAGVWLAAICRNVARSMAVARKIERCCEDMTAVSAQPPLDDRLDEVRQAVSQLSDADRELIYMRYHNAMSYQRIAQMLGSSPQGINGRLRRAKRKIEAILLRNGVMEMKS